MAATVKIQISFESLVEAILKDEKRERQIVQKAVS